MFYFFYIPSYPSTLSALIICKELAFKTISCVISSCLCLAHLYMKGATVAVLGWLCCCCWGSCTAPLPASAPTPPSPWEAAVPESAEVLVDDTMLVLRFSSPPKDLCIYIDWQLLLSLVLSAVVTGTLAALGCITAGLVVAVGAFKPDLGMPLEAGIALSFFTEAEVLLPLGMRLAILELFFVGSTITGSSLGGVLALLFVLFLSSLSLGCGKDLLLWFLLLLAMFLFGGAKDGMDVFPCLFEIPQGGVGLHMPSSPHSDMSSSSCRDISATDGEVLDADRGLMRRNFSNMERWLPGADLEASVTGGRRRSDKQGGVGEAVGLGGLVANMDEVALCFTFMDLLRQVFPAVGEGKAEASCCPLVLEGTDPLPFILPGRGMPFTDSMQWKQN